MQSKVLILLISISLSSTMYGQCYDPAYVSISEVLHKGDSYNLVTMKRSGGRVKAKYFGAIVEDGQSVAERFLEWSRNNSGLILFSSGTYKNFANSPIGLNIDAGNLVNLNMEFGGMDGLVLVYPNGGVAVSDLKAGNLSVSGISRSLDIRGNFQDFEDFVKWAIANRATVFQTHLLVFKNQLKINPAKADPTERERRFLAVGTDENGDILHLIVHNSTYTSLYDGAQKVLNFLKEGRNMEVIFMINLDTGAQDVFQLYNSNCSENNSIKGQLSLAYAENLLVYYFE